MKTLNIKTSELMTKLIDNRETHENEYNDSMVGYREKVINDLEMALSAAKNGGTIKTYFSLTEPKSSLESYDIAIEMCKMSVDETIELTQNEFKQYVMDKWDWSDSFKMLASSYSL